MVVPGHRTPACKRCRGSSRRDRAPHDRRARLRAARRVNLADRRSQDRALRVLHPATTTLHGAQLWVALPEAGALQSAFEHYAPPVIEVDGARVLVFLEASSAGVAGVDALRTRRRG